MALIFREPQPFVWGVEGVGSVGSGWESVADAGGASRRISPCEVFIAVILFFSLMTIASTTGTWFLAMGIILS
jgi:hypothetical protein